MLRWRVQKTSAIKPHTKFDKWCHIHAQHLPSSCRHIYTTDTGFKPLSITEGSKACLLAGRSWSKFLRALIWNPVRDYFFAHKEFKMKGKGVVYTVHTQTNIPLVHMLPLVSSILWIFPGMWQCWRVVTRISRTLLQLFTWVRNIQKLSQTQRNSWGYGMGEANMVISMGWNICWVQV